MIDTIRRRAGLRDTFAVHRRAPSISKTSDKQSNISSITHSSMASFKFPRRPLNTAVPSPTPSAKQVERDIIKHASRIRTNHSNECSTRPTSSVQSYYRNQTPLMSASSIQTSKRETKRAKLHKTSISMNLVSLQDSLIKYEENQ
jgi:hypothetical protein